MAKAQIQSIYHSFHLQRIYSETAINSVPKRRNLKFQFDPWVGIAMKNVSPTKEEFTTDNRKEEIGKKLELEMK